MRYLLFCFLFIYHASLLPSDFEPLQREVALMGTTLKLTLFDQDPSSAMKQSEEWIRIVEKAEQQWSNWRDTSEVSQVNRQHLQTPIQLSEELCHTLPLLQTYKSQTGGVFDPGIGQLLKIWGYYGKPRIPSNEEINQALQSSGVAKVQIDKNKCTATRIADVLLDSGAFGKGLALEQILSHAQTNNAAPFLADFGGQLLIYHKSQEAELAHPESRNKGSGIKVQFQSGSLSTSGSSERDQFMNGKRIGHIVDPRTGNPAPFSGSVTVWHQSPLAADVLSTALYVLGPQEGLVWANKNQIAACFISIRNEKLTAIKSFRFDQLLE